MGDDGRGHGIPGRAARPRALGEGGCHQDMDYDRLEAEDTVEGAEHGKPAASLVEGLDKDMLGPEHGSPLDIKVL